MNQLRTSSVRTRVIMAAVVLALVLMLTYVSWALTNSRNIDRAGGTLDGSLTVEDGSGSTSTSTPAPPSTTDPLAGLQVQAPVSSPAYVRDAFGDAWEDVDNNGCDTRNDILIRDLTAITWRSDDVGCTVATGTLVDPYTGKTIHFVRGRSTSIKVQIDHIIPLAYAWRQGAWAWTDAQRLAFANDRDNLIAVDGPTNGSKSDSGPSEWLPPNTAHYCQYLDDFVEVLIEYRLSVPQSDYDLLRQASRSCALG